jgi:flagellar hook-basal body complex protein FliE
MSNMQIDSVLAQIRSLQQQTQIGAPKLGAASGLAGSGATLAPGQPSFATVLQQGLQQVSNTEANATRLATEFEKGTPGVELSQVMLEAQKANVSFRGAVEVRNRLVSAYQEIMAMQI